MQTSNIFKHKWNPGNKRQAIVVYWFMSSHCNFMYTLICALGLLIANTTALVKMIIKHVGW